MDLKFIPNAKRSQNTKSAQMLMQINQMCSEIAQDVSHRQPFASKPQVDYKPRPKLRLEEYRYKETYLPTPFKKPRIDFNTSYPLGEGKIGDGHLQIDEQLNVFNTPGPSAQVVNITDSSHTTGTLPMIHCLRAIMQKDSSAAHSRQSRVLTQLL
jgi:hypothetical protein